MLTKSGHMKSRHHPKHGIKRDSPTFAAATLLIAAEK